MGRNTGFFGGDPKCRSRNSLSNGTSLFVALIYSVFVGGTGIGLVNASNRLVPLGQMRSDQKWSAILVLDMITVNHYRRTGYVSVKGIRSGVVPIEKCKAALVLAVIIPIRSLGRNNGLRIRPFSIGFHQLLHPFEAFIEAYNSSIAHLIGYIGLESRIQGLKHLGKSPRLHGAVGSIGKEPLGVQEEKELIQRRHNTIASVQPKIGAFPEGLAGFLNERRFPGIFACCDLDIVVGRIFAVVKDTDRGFEFGFKRCTFLF